LPAAFKISCNIAGRRSGWRERAHHALICGVYIHGITNALASTMHWNSNSVD
jgi:hypothetical protein